MPAFRVHATFSRLWVNIFVVWSPFIAMMPNTYRLEVRRAAAQQPPKLNLNTQGTFLKRPTERLYRVGHRSIRFIRFAVLFL